MRTLTGAARAFITTFAPQSARTVPSTFKSLEAP